jgi:hypothetical protein
VSWSTVALSPVQAYKFLRTKKKHVGKHESFGVARGVLWPHTTATARATASTNQLDSPTTFTSTSDLINTRKAHAHQSDVKVLSERQSELTTC